jgi:hypothetical protein
VLTTLRLFLLNEDGFCGLSIGRPEFLDFLDTIPLERRTNIFGENIFDVRGLLEKVLCC